MIFTSKPLQKIGSGLGYFLIIIMAIIIIMIIIILLLFLFRGIAQAYISLAGSLNHL